MKRTSLSSFRLDRKLRLAIAGVLFEGETLASFRELAVRSEVARRQRLLNLAASRLISAGRFAQPRDSIDATSIQAEFLFALVAELKTSAARAAAALDQTIQRLDESERRRPKLEAMARERALLEFADLRH
jgi:hypothetical protein